MFWNDITQALTQNPELVRKHYADFFRENPPTTPSVISFNQSGGQTAHTIVNNERPPRRVVGQTIPGHFVDRLKSNPPTSIEIDVQASDPDAPQFGEQLFQMFRQIGWQIERRPGRTFCPDIVHNVRIETEFESEVDADSLVALAEWLNSIGVETSFHLGLKRNKVVVGDRDT